MALAETIDKALVNAEKLKANGSGNEANTKALLIEPLLAALGWDPVDLDAVEREVRVYEGTFLDYALKIGGSPRVYVEAKAVGENLDDKRYIAQAINYANNDGVVWCVLTNGVRWRVYKTNETAPMDQKRLFDVDLSDQTESSGEMQRLLRLVRREAVAGGELDRFGDRVFTDGRVRAALAALAADPPAGFLELIGGRLGHPDVPRDALARSVARVLDAPEPNDAGGPGSAIATAGPPVPPRRAEYPLDHHLGNKSALIVELFRTHRTRPARRGHVSGAAGVRTPRRLSSRVHCPDDGRLESAISPHRRARLGRAERADPRSGGAERADGHGVPARRRA